MIQSPSKQALQKPIQIENHQTAALLQQIKFSFEQFNTSFISLNAWKDQFLRKQFSASIKSDFIVAFGQLMRSKLSLSDPLHKLLSESYNTQIKISKSDDQAKNQSKIIEKQQKEKVEAIDQPKMDDILKSSLRQIEVLSAQLQKSKADKRLSMWEIVIKKAVRHKQMNVKKPNKYAVKKAKLTQFDQDEIDRIVEQKKNLLNRKYSSQVDLREIFN